MMSMSPEGWDLYSPAYRQGPRPRAYCRFRLLSPQPNPPLHSLCWHTVEIALSLPSNKSSFPIYAECSARGGMCTLSPINSLVLGSNIEENLDDLELARTLAPIDNQDFGSRRRSTNCRLGPARALNQINGDGDGGADQVYRELTDTHLSTGAQFCSESSRRFGSSPLVRKTTTWRLTTNMKIGWASVSHWRHKVSSANPLAYFGDYLTNCGSPHVNFMVCTTDASISGLASGLALMGSPWVSWQRTRPR